jgi:hypothetical protein
MKKARKEQKKKHELIASIISKNKKAAKIQHLKLKVMGKEFFINILNAEI